MTLVLIPGFMLDADLWREMEPGLQAFGPIIHAEMGRDGSIDGMAARVVDDVAGPFAIIGFSMGGYVARAVARRVPDRLQALVLIATSARGDTAAQASRKAIAIQNVARTPFNGVSSRAIARSLHPDHADPETIERIQAMSRRLGGEAFLRQAGMSREGDLGQLGEIRCPSLIIAAAQDALRSVAEARELQAGIPGASLEVIEGSGHMLPIEAPGVLLGCVVPWLTQVLRAG
jgi:pimeloyl-ACP methyl ester carboxylesterase